MKSAFLGSIWIIEVGVTHVRYVALEHARPWVIHAYRNIKGRGFHKEEEVKGTEVAIKGHEMEVPTIQETNATKPHVEDRIDIKEIYDKIVESVVDSITPRKRKFEDTCNTSKGTGRKNVNVADQNNENSELGAKRQKFDHDTDLGKEVIEIKDQSQLSNENRLGSLSENTNKAVGDENKHLENERNGTTQLENSENSTTSLNDTKEEIKSRHERNIKKFDDDSPEPTEDPPPRSSYDKVRLVIQPWRKPEGGINKPILKMMLESVMLFLMMNPFSTEKALNKRYSPYLQPMPLKTIIKILEEIGCIKTKYIKQTKCSLFSKPTLPEFSSAENEDHMAMYIPTEECLFRLGQFGREFYPQAKWPQSTL